MEELRILKGFDVIVYFNVPPFFQMEIVVDPPFIGWHRDKLRTDLCLTKNQILFFEVPLSLRVCLRLCW